MMGNSRISVPTVKKFGPVRDRSSVNMVRYNYFKVTMEDGSNKIMYGGSIRAVKRQLDEDKVKYLGVVEIPYQQAQQELSEEERMKLRKHNKSVYTNRGIKRIEV